jgi:GTP-binding protein EngB required for normal cell division
MQGHELSQRVDHKDKAFNNFLTILQFSSHLSTPIQFEPIKNNNFDQDGIIHQIIVIGNIGNGKSTLLNKLMNLEKLAGNRENSVI